MSHVQSAAEPASALPAARRVAALAVRLLETPAALILQRAPEGWRVVAASGEQADRLTGETLRHAALLDTERDLLVVPDLTDAPELAAFIPPPVPGTPRLRFLAAAAVPLEASAEPSLSAADAITGARPRDWLCLLDGRPRQFRAADRNSSGNSPPSSATPPPRPRRPPNAKSARRT